MNIRRRPILIGALGAFCGGRRKQRKSRRKLEMEASMEKRITEETGGKPVEEVSGRRLLPLFDRCAVVGRPPPPSWEPSPPFHGPHDFADWRPAIPTIIRPYFHSTGCRPESVDSGRRRSFGVPGSVDRSLGLALILVDCLPARHRLDIAKRRSTAF